MQICRQIKNLTMLLILFTGLSVVQAAPVTWNFRLNQNNGVESGSDFSNAYEFDSNGEIINATAWSDITGTMQRSNVTWLNPGIGVCNNAEGATVADCETGRGRNRRRQSDNEGEQDWVLLFLPENVRFQGVNIDPIGNRDRDATFWVGTISDPTDLLNEDYASLSSLGFGAENYAENTVGRQQVTVSLNNRAGNALLIGAARGQNDDYFMVRTLTVETVPIPPAIWLFGSALAGLGWLKKKNRTE